LLTNTQNQLLKADPKKDKNGVWAGRIFEIFVKLRLLREKGFAVELDYSLPNEKEVDIRLETGGNIYFIECTTLTDSDKDIGFWNEFIEKKKEDCNYTEGRWRDPYHDTLRFYAKVYDKIAKKLNPKESQLGKNTKNLLLISFSTSKSPLFPESPEIGWALDELFADQPKSSHQDKTSLINWIDFYADELSKKSLLNLDKFYDKDCDDVIIAPRKIGGILLFQNCSLKKSRVNYNANEQCKLSHSEMAKLETIFSIPPIW